MPYRSVHQGWDGEAAYDKARDLGMRWWYSEAKSELAEFTRVERIVGDASRPRRIPQTLREVTRLLR
jgi:hypothetical protein